jgi:DNA-binding XRE family transcriptional regulator
MPKNAVSALHVEDEDFLVASLIERCPKTMMVRELMMNAIEAARLAPEGQRLIEISAQPLDGVAKLVIWNTGPGMDAGQLLQMSNIASSIGKEKSLTGNFGMGAKVAALPSNQRGIRYRSCKMGHVHEVILCKSDNIYGRLRRYDQSGDDCEVVDVTDIAVAEGRTVEYDWTEVVLLGNKADQDTVKNPYNGDPEQDSQWLATYLYHRFYRLPDGMRVNLLKRTHKLDGNRQFLPIPARTNFFEKKETVEANGGIKIHYLYDAPYDNLKEAMATNVRRVRHARGFTQEELADRAGLSARYLGSIERADVSASVTILGRLAQALRVDACELIHVPPRRQARPDR